MQKIKLPRKIKKELKKLILKGKSKEWKSKDVRIREVKKHHLRNVFIPTYKNNTVVSYSLGL